LVSKTADALNGTLSDEAFVDYVFDAEAADGLVYAHQATYDSTERADSIFVVLAEMETADDANRYNGLAKKEGPFRDARADPAVKPKVSTIPGLKGATLIEPTKIDRNNTFDHAVVAVKGKRVMFIDYLTRSEGEISGLVDLAKQQYSLL
jgi:hypothetical protein